MKEYKMAKGWAIFIFVTAPLMIGLFSMPILLLFIPNWRTNEPAEFFWFAIPVSIVLIALMIAGIADTIVSKVTLTEQSIDYKNILFRRSIQLNEIKGFRIDDKYLFIEAKTPGVKRVKISTYFGKLEELVVILANRYPDLNEREAEESYQTIIKDDNYGFSVTERRVQLQKAKVSATIMNWAAGVIAAWTFFWPVPYPVAIVASILCPIVVIILLKIFRGLIHLNDRKNSPYPSLFWAFFISSMALALRALLDLNIYDHEGVWWLVLPMTLLLSGVLFIGNREFDWQKGRDIFTASVIVCIIFAYSYVAVLSTNCTFDQSNSTLFRTQILEKEISSSKTTTYYFHLAPWEQGNTRELVSVNKQLYQQLQEGDSVQVLFFEGRWGIPWFIVKP